MLFHASCVGKKCEIENLTDRKCLDSTLLYKADSLKTIAIGSDITANPLSSQFYDNNGITEYILLDENKLYFFNYETGMLSRQMKISTSEDTGCGILNNYSGFFYHTADSIFVYNYRLKRVFLIDSTSNINNKWNILRKDLAKYPVDPESLTSSPILFVNNHLILSGTEHGQPADATFDNKPISCIINLATNEVTYGGGYPQQYRDCNFGGVYFNEIFHTVNNDKNVILYSFQADHYVYQYNDNVSDGKMIYAGSRYIKKIESSNLSFLELYKNKDKRIEYYVSQPSYMNILYDKYRKLYYRIASTPLYNWNVEKRTFQKPFSIIVLNTAGEILSETPIFENYELLNLHNMHVTHEGIIIQKNNKDENNIYFELYKIK